MVYSEGWAGPLVIDRLVEQDSTSIAPLSGVENMRRSSTALAVVCWLAVFTDNRVAVGTSGIAQTDGQIQVTASPPSLAIGALVSDSTAWLMIERPTGTFNSPFRVEVTGAGDYRAGGDVPVGVDVTGTRRLTSFLLHVNSASGQLTRYAGEITFVSPIIGGMFTNAGLINSDSNLGHLGTTYATTPRQLELAATSGSQLDDRFAISADLRTLMFDVAVTSGIDELRIVTSVIRGDADSDGDVDFADLLALAQHYGSTSGNQWESGDFTFDSAVDFTDLLALAQNYGSGTGVSPNLDNDWKLARASVPEASCFWAASSALVSKFFSRGHRRRSRV